MTMQFEYDPERLIEEVRKRPGIWDYGDSEYRAKNMRYRLWNEIVTELMSSDVKVTKSEMRELGTYIVFVLISCLFCVFCTELR